jgi:hypothetical protein
LSVSVRFSFFSFLLIKSKPNRTGRFFQKFNRFNRFFFSVQFFQLFFFRFSRFNRFSDFFAHPYLLTSMLLFCQTCFLVIQQSIENINYLTY